LTTFSITKKGLSWEGLELGAGWLVIKNILQDYAKKN
jgi:hypothetical protein